MSTNSKRVVKLVLLTALDTETQMSIRDIRNEVGIRKWMYTDHVIEVNEHLAWLSRVKRDDRQIVFVVMDDESIPLGIVSVSGIDRVHSKADWAFYLTKSARGGLGSALEYSFLNFVFDSLRIEKLNCEVIEGNDAVVKLHKRFLFQEEGFRRSNIVRSGTRVGAYMLGLTKADWHEGRDSIDEKYDLSDRFSVSIGWDGTEGCGEANPIDEIERARERNNLNWMTILRLALDKSPESARAIVTDIKKIDHEISVLTEKLI